MTLAALAALLLAAPALAQEKKPVALPKGWDPPPAITFPNYRDQWRQVLIELAAYAKKRNPSFVVVMRGGVELLVKGLREVLWEQRRDPLGRNAAKRLPEDSPMRPLIRALDGLAIDGLYCGPYKFDKPLAQAIKERKDYDNELSQERRAGIHRPSAPVPLGPFSLDPKEELRKAKENQQAQDREERQRREIYAMDAMRSEGRALLSFDVGCANQGEVDTAYRNGDRDRVLTFAAVDDARLDQMPRGRPRHENANAITTLNDAHNMMALMKSDRFGSRAEWIMAMEDANYDVVVVDVAHRGADPLTKNDVYRMKFKKLGPPRLVLAALPIGRAYDWRWYWQKGWGPGNPSYLTAYDPDAPGAFIVDAADMEWKKLLGKTMAGIMDVGFDGVVFDDIGTYQYFEDLTPLGE